MGSEMCIRDRLLPVYEYYTSKTKINNVGIIPDIVVNDKLMDDWVKKI